MKKTLPVLIVVLFFWVSRCTVYLHPSLLSALRQISEGGGTMINSIVEPAYRAYNMAQMVSIEHEERQVSCVNCEQEVKETEGRVRKEDR
jgi:hypothetical protein